MKERLLNLAPDMCAFEVGQRLLCYADLNGWQQGWICFAQAFAPLLLRLWGKKYV